MVEVVTAALEDQLVDPLSFKLTKTASYITKRRSCTFHASGSNIYHPRTGVKLIKILISGHDWLDPGTVRLMFDLKNDHPDRRLYPVGGAHGFFNRLRILAQGQVIEDINDYNRVHEMFQVFSASESRNNDYASGLASNWQAHATSKELLTTTKGLVSISGSQTMTGMLKLNAGIFQTKKYLPLQFMPLTIELSLVDDPLEPIIHGGDSTTASAFITTNSSDIWSILNVQAKCDLVTLDNSYEEDFFKSLSEGTPLYINYNTLISQIQTISGNSNLNVNVSRSLTRLKSVFVSLIKNLTSDADAGAGGSLDRRNKDHVGSKVWNEFFSPMYGEFDRTPKVHTLAGEFEFQLQIGSYLFPEYRIRSHAEAFYNLQKTLGIRSNSMHNFNVSGDEYRRDKLILGIDTEKILEAGFSGLSTRSGDLMTVLFKYNSDGGAGTPRLADRMHIVLHSDQILEVHSHGVRVLD